MKLFHVGFIIFLCTYVDIQAMRNKACQCSESITRSIRESKQECGKKACCCCPIMYCFLIWGLGPIKREYPIVPTIKPPQAPAQENMDANVSPIQ